MVAVYGEYIKALATLHHGNFNPLYIQVAFKVQAAFVPHRPHGT